MKRLLILIAFLASTAGAQVQLSPWVEAQWFDNNGHPVSSGCLFTYASGTSTPLATYTDFTGSVPNTNPVILDSAGRANVWLSGQAYRFRLVTQGGTNCSAGIQLFQIDGINPSTASLLALTNTWTGNNTFNGQSIFNGVTSFTLGFTSTGPSIMNLGGTMNGTFAGSPIFSGVPNFSSGFAATTGLFSDQITSTLITGTPPFVVTSTTQVANLNVSELEGGTWEVPNVLGGTTPNAIAATTLSAATSFTLDGSVPETTVQGTDTSLVSGGSFAGPLASPACEDANNGITTSASVCVPVHWTNYGNLVGGVCSTTNSAGNTCTSTVTWNTPEPDTLYSVACSGVTHTGFPFIIDVSKGLASVTVTISNGTASQAVISSFAEIDCVAVNK